MRCTVITFQCYSEHLKTQLPPLRGLSPRAVVKWLGRGWKGSVVGDEELGKALVLDMSALIFCAQQVMGKLREQTCFTWLQGQAMALLGLSVMTPPMSPQSQALFLSPFYRRGNEGPRRQGPCGEHCGCSRRPITLGLVLQVPHPKKPLVPECKVHRGKSFVYDYNPSTQNSSAHCRCSINIFE